MDGHDRRRLEAALRRVDDVRAFRRVQALLLVAECAYRRDRDSPGEIVRCNIAREL